MKRYPVVDHVTMTIPCSSNEYIFQVSLSGLGMDDLAHDKWLGFRFKKNRHRFLSDLADVLSGEILIQLEKMTEAKHEAELQREEDIREHNKQILGDLNDCPPRFRMAGPITPKDKA